MRLFQILAIFVMSFGGAQAAEAPAGRAKPAKPNKCAAYGEGFIYAPSTDSCIRMGGAVSADFSSGSPSYQWNGPTK